MASASVILRHELAPQPSDSATLISLVPQNSLMSFSSVT